jgi:ketosteroid isomerase-like protein
MNDVATRNEELVRRIFERHNQGPEEFLASLDEFYDPEVEWTPVVVGGLEGRSYHGYEGWRRYYADRGDVFATGRVDVLGCEAVADDVLVAHIRSSGVGRASGLATDHKIWSVAWFRDGRVLRQQVFTDRTQAYEAASA